MPPVVLEMKIALLKAVHVTTIHVTGAALCSFVQPDNMSRQMEAFV